MKLYRQLVLFILGATLVPLLAAFVILHQHEKQLRHSLLERGRMAAGQLAGVIDRQLEEIFERLQRAAGYTRLEEMSEDELEGWLTILYKQSEHITQTVLMDGSGRRLAPAVYLEEPQRYPEYAGRLAVDGPGAEEFVSRLPWRKAGESSPGRLVLGELYLRGGRLLLPLALPVSGRGETPWIAGAEISLGRLLQNLEDIGRGEGWRTWLLDERGRMLPGLEPPESGLLLAPLAAAAAEGRTEAVFQQQAILAGAPIQQLGWTVLIMERESGALEQIRRARIVTLSWTAASIVLLLVAGGWFTGRITRKIGRLVEGAEALGGGNLSARVHVGGRDELALLARSFNQMAGQLQASREEIERWNRELQQRVKERTRQLEAAHQKLLETSKLAAIGQLGAGVAHEINNPLVAILGNVQLLLARSPAEEKTRQMLEKIEASAKRCREITQNLLRFSEPEEVADHLPLQVAKILHDAYDLTAQQLEVLGIETTWQVEENLWVLGDWRQLVRVFWNLLVNARTAMQKKGGRLTLAARKKDQQVVVEITDTGEGIAPDILPRIFEPFFTTKQVWSNTGLGLSVAYRVVADHGGSIEVESQPGAGSTFRVILPQYREGSR
jgi:two-component system NtrC family sensor kinase